jgi:hypothetical protein
MSGEFFACGPALHLRVPDTRIKSGLRVKIALCCCELPKANQPEIVPRSLLRPLFQPHTVITSHASKPPRAKPRQAPFQHRSPCRGGQVRRSRCVRPHTLRPASWLRAHLRRIIFSAAPARFFQAVVEGHATSSVRDLPASLASILRGHERSSSPDRRSEDSRNET